MSEPRTQAPSPNATPPYRQHIFSFGVLGTLMSKYGDSDTLEGRIISMLSMNRLSGTLSWVVLLRPTELNFSGLGWRLSSVWTK